ncbi:MAG: polymer-forming cytoskeletal protein [Pseudomonadota bacterium]
MTNIPTGDVFAEAVARTQAADQTQQQENPKPARLTGFLKPGSAPKPVPQPPKLPSRTMGAVQTLAQADGLSVIGTGLEIGGDNLSIKTEGTLRIDGTFGGAVVCDEVIVGREGVVRGAIKARRVIVEGRVEGPIEGGNVALKPSAVVKGDIAHEALAIEGGAEFDGLARRIKASANVSSAPPLKLVEVAPFGRGSSTK